ncbi:MAG: cation:proton antiporter [Balneolaceae bacterium]
MDEYNVLLLIIGVALLIAALVPIRLKKAPVSLPMIYLGLGALLPLIMKGLPELNPLEYGNITEKLTQLAVIISLVSAGLKIDRLEGWNRWNSTWRLLGITMPLCIAALAFSGSWLMGLPLGAAVLLGAVMAPTDPVLASDVQVGPPGERNEHEVRFALTSEAGLNDALAFPFVNLALVLAATGLEMDGLTHWFTVDVLWKLTAGLVMGVITGYISGSIVPDTKSIKAPTEGFVTLALTLVAYGATELVHGYGFLGVFVAARTFRHFKIDDQLYKDLHDFSDQMEKLLMTTIMLSLGAAATQGLLVGLTWNVVIIAILFVLVIRPVAVFISFIGSGIEFKTQAMLGLFGIRGIGSFYYLAYGLNFSNIGEMYGEILWATTGLIVVISVILHGFTVSYAMAKI